MPAHAYLLNCPLEFFGIICQRFRRDQHDGLIALPTVGPIHWTVVDSKSAARYSFSETEMTCENKVFPVPYSHPGNSFGVAIGHKIFQVDKPTLTHITCSRYASGVPRTGLAGSLLVKLTATPVSWPELPSPAPSTTCLCPNPRLPHWPPDSPRQISPCHQGRCNCRP